MPLPLPGITLPLSFSRVAPASIQESRVYVSACINFLTSPLVSSVLECHPNDAAICGPRPEWKTWWKWATAPGRDKWKVLIPGVGNISVEWRGNIPIEITEMLETIDQLVLPRAPNFKFVPEPGSSSRGMSPKKAHEVSQMSAFIQFVLNQDFPGVKHVVDIGAGQVGQVTLSNAGAVLISGSLIDHQGYLSRALSDQPLAMNVLALDFSETQTRGAERRTYNITRKLTKAVVNKEERSPGSAGSLTFETIHITPQTLHAAVSRWVSVQSVLTPVLLVALHACGTLTPDILRCFLANQKETTVSGLPRHWYAAGLVVIGCCYNLMSPDSDFPLSRTVMKEIDMQEKLHLSYNHRSLAAQSPLQWTMNGSVKATAELAVRKVVYRALYGKLASISTPINLGSSHSRPQERPFKLGRLHDSAYSSLQGFILEANKKAMIEVPIPEDVEQENLGLTSGLEVLHILRSRIGPVIESLIIADRYLYLAEQTRDSDVFAFNLFEQDLGSGRNVALVVIPH